MVETEIDVTALAPFCARNAVSPMDGAVMLMDPGPWGFQSITDGVTGQPG